MKSHSQEDSGFESCSDNDMVINETDLNKDTNEQEQLNFPALNSITPILPPCKPLAASGHSLQTDMLFGWRPKSMGQGGPVPLDFSLDPTPSQKEPIFYGFRPSNSYIMHQSITPKAAYSFKINPALKHSYNYIKGMQPKPDSRPFVGMKVGLETDQLKFSSDFQSGNLDKVVKLKEDEYDLYIRPDSNTKGHNQWFYFSVSNICNTRTVKFNIVNFHKRDSLYKVGMSPSVYSMINSDRGWIKSGDQIKYYYSRINEHLCKKRPYYCLSFQYTLIEGDEVYFANTEPYTYSKLLKFLQQLQGSKFVQRSSLCKSLGGVDVPLISITDLQVFSPKQLIFVTGRVHPGQTNGSFVTEGFIKFLVCENPKAVQMRKKFIFKIVPMLNPDGVILGNNRCNLAGDDLNRKFRHPDSRLHPTVLNVKEKLTALLQEFQAFAYFDFHAHSKKKSSFVYGPYYPLHSSKYYEIRAIPKLVSEITEAFRYYSSKFRDDWSKRNTARLVIWKQFGIPLTFTIQNSYYGYVDSQRNTVLYEQAALKMVGESVALGVYQFSTLKEIQRIENACRKQDRLIFRNRKKEMKKIEQTENFSRKISQQKRTIADLFRSIQVNRVQQEDQEQSDSGGSDSDQSDQENTEIKMNILSVLNQVDQWLGIQPKPSFPKPQIPSNQQSSFQVNPNPRSTYTKYILQDKKEKKPQRIQLKQPNSRTISISTNTQRPLTHSRPGSRVHSRLSYSRAVQNIRPKAPEIFQKNKQLRPITHQFYRRERTPSMHFEKGFQKTREAFKKQQTLPVTERSLLTTTKKSTKYRIVFSVTGKRVETNRARNSIGPLIFDHYPI